MLPLDTVNSEGVFRYAGSAWFAQALQLLVASGAHGVAMDFWWGAVERAPGQYSWSGYKQALEVIKQTGLKVQVVLSFHACGGNVGDTVQIPLPDWVIQCGEADPDLFFADRPRNGGLGNRNREYISIWADDAPGVLRGRSPMQCYEDFMVSLRENFSQELGTVIDEVVVGAGPCGELRLPSYVEANGWRFPGAGEFQCYDRRALASLAQAAREAGHPEWGYTGPHDAGEYNSTPEHTGFFSHNGSWNTPYGRFFLEWYSGCLLKHGDRLLTIANAVFASKLNPPPQPPQSLLQTLGAAGSALAAQLQQVAQQAVGSLGHGSNGSNGNGSGPSSSQGVQAFLTPAAPFGGISSYVANTPFQPMAFMGLHTSQTSSGGPRMSTHSLNRILETGCSCGSGPGSGNASGNELNGAASADCGGMPPPSGPPPPRRQATESMLLSSCGAPSSISPSCTYSSMSTCTGASSGGASGSTANMVMATAGSSGSLMSPQSMSVFHGTACGAPHSEAHGGAGGMVPAGGVLGGRRSSGGGAAGSPHNASGVFSAAMNAMVTRGVATAAALMQAAAAQGGVATGMAATTARAAAATSGSSSRTSSDSAGATHVAVAGAAALASGDATMIDVEPSDNSHTSTVADLMNAQGLSGSSNASGPLAHPLNAAAQPGTLAPPAVAPAASGAVIVTPVAGGHASCHPSPLSAVRFRSSASTLADAEPMFGSGQGTAFAAVAAAGVIIASGHTARMDLCNSLSSLSTEFTTTGATHGPGTNASMHYLDVAASLVADGDDESEIGTSCCTGGAAEEADELFLGAGHSAGRRAESGIAEHAATLSLVPPAAGRPLHHGQSAGTSSGSSGGGGLQAQLQLQQSQQHGSRLAGIYSDDGRRSSVELGGMGLGVATLGVGMSTATAATAAISGVGGVAAAAANPVSALLSPTTSCQVNGTSPAVGTSSSSGGGAGAAVYGATGMHLALKIAGIHWWYRSRSHAAELTAGYYNVDGHDGYEAIVNLCARHRANLVLTCVEMCDSQHPAQAQCGPEGLLRQLRQLAARAGVQLSGENALPIFSSGGVDNDALDRIVNNMRAWPMPSNNVNSRVGISPAPSMAMPGNGNNGNGNGNGMAHAPSGGNIVCVGYRMSESGRMVPVGTAASAVVNASSLNGNGNGNGYGSNGSGGHSGAESGAQTNGQHAAVTPYGSTDLNGTACGVGTCLSPAPPDVLPSLRAFTFLRLVPEMLLPGYQSLWMRFMGKLMAS
ncbi:hypothetical protein HYH02_006335 [Chlamydomonas schloesseri]|uniref:Beta-amylase n=1 Tax=Chlamydomonas schloesseri TaxID=2026947 RepID=A0A835WJI0_9CHLO|nr:hypothetical protein HYH02_006335 [Chlamydomonas schloesseri]|eukprot:KAG2448443.1 hypothetical protein HYH02_006335 [Chlamydomonas schloesseri]